MAGAAITNWNIRHAVCALPLACLAQGSGLEAKDE